MEPYSYKPHTCRNKAPTLSSSRKRKPISNLYMKTEPGYEMDSFLKSQAAIKEAIMNEEPRSSLKLTAPVTQESEPHDDIHTRVHKNEKIKRLNTIEFDEKCQDNKMMKNALREEARNAILKNYTKPDENDFDKKVTEQRDTNRSLIDSLLQKVGNHIKKPNLKQNQADQKKGDQKPLISQLDAVLVESTFPEVQTQEPTYVDLYGDGYFEKEEQKPKKKERYTGRNTEKELHHQDKYFEYAKCKVKKIKPYRSKKQQEEYDRLLKSEYKEHPEFKKIDEQYAKNKGYESMLKQGRGSEYDEKYGYRSAILINNPYRPEEEYMIDNPINPAKEFIEIDKRSVSPGHHKSSAYLGRSSNPYPNMSEYEQMLEKELETANLKIDYFKYNKFQLPKEKYSPQKPERTYDEFNYEDSP